MSRASVLLGGLALAGLACSVTTDATRRLVTYGISVHPCRPNDCSVPDDSVGITGADRGDTVWLFAFVEGGNPLVGDSALVRLRPDCAENLALLDGAGAAVRTEAGVRDSVVGVLDLESALPDAFRPANVLAFEAFADQVAGAIHLASMYDRVADTTLKLEQKTRDLEQANAHLANAIETLHRISTQDGLTGVSNRRHFDETIGLEWRRAARSRDPLSLLMLDIDYFKAFNDSAGHQAGDDCLRRVAQTLRNSVHRAADLVARYGGEEFAVLLPACAPREAFRVAERLRAAVAGATDLPVPLTVSAGVAGMPANASTADELLRAADSALYSAKRTGRDRTARARESGHARRGGRRRSHARPAAAGAARRGS